MKIFSNVLVVLLATAAIIAGSTASASAASCKTYVNPAMAGYNASWQDPRPGGGIYPMGYTGTLYTGSSSSACSDINASGVSGNICSIFKNKAIFVVQYLSKGVWHTDDQGPTGILCGSSVLKAIGQGYANNTPFRVLVDLAYPMHDWPWFTLSV